MYSVIKMECTKSKQLLGNFLLHDCIIFWIFHMGFNWLAILLQGIIFQNEDNEFQNF